MGHRGRTVSCELRAESSRVERFNTLYERHAPDVLAYVLRRCPRDVVADVVSEVFTVAWRRLADVPSDPLLWLLATARRCLANQRRATQRQLAHRDRLRVATCPASAEVDEPTLRSERVAAAIRSLSECDREALLLIAWDELDTFKAAEVLGCSPTAFRLRLHRARHRFRKALQSATTSADSDRPGFTAVGLSRPVLTPTRSRR
jgi:RNA polymerase sigma-70 factor (ECF subfamily)